MPATPPIKRGRGRPRKNPLPEPTPPAVDHAGQALVRIPPGEKPKPMVLKRSPPPEETTPDSFFEEEDPLPPTPPSPQNIDPDEDEDEDEDEESDEEDEDDEVEDAAPPPAAAAPAPTYRGMPPPPPPSSHVEEVAKAVQTYANVSALPPLEIDPSRRELPTMGTVAFTEEIPDFSKDGSPPNSLEDLLSRFPIGDGQYYVTVNRKKPPSWGGAACAGTQKSMYKPLGLEEFVACYGGGEYHLQVYGPPRRGGIVNPITGRMQPKRLTEPVVLVVPYSPPYGYPPNPESGVEVADVSYGDEDDDYQEDHMRHYGSPIPRRPTTPGDAKIVETTLEHEMRLKEHQDRREREIEERARASVQSEQQRLSPVIEAVERNHAAAFDFMQAAQARREQELAEERAEERRRRVEAEERLREQEEERRAEERRRIAEREAEIERERRQAESRPTSMKDTVDAIGALIGSLNNDKGANKSEISLLQQHIASLQERHSMDLKQVHETHQNELRREREAHDQALARENQRARESIEIADRRAKDLVDSSERRSKDAIDSAERRMRDAEDRASRLISEADGKIERAVAQAKEEADKKVAEFERIFKDRLAAEEKNHERELRSLKESFETRINMEVRLAETQRTTLLSEVERERSEAARLKSELGEKGDLAAQITKYTEAANLLGLQRPEGGAETPMDWKTMALSAVGQLAQNLPELLKNAGTAVAQARGTQVNVNQYPNPPMFPDPMTSPQLPGMPPRPPPPRMPFATEYDPDFVGHVAAPPPYQPPPPPMMPQPLDPMQPQPMSQPPLPMQQQMAPMSSPPPPMQNGMQAFNNQPGMPPPMQQQNPSPPAASGGRGRRGRRQHHQQPEAPPALPSGSAPSIQLGPEQLSQLRTMLETALASEIDPKTLVQQLAALNGGNDQVRALAQSISLEQVVSGVMSMPDGARSPLVRRDGQQYLRQVLAEALAL